MQGHGAATEFFSRFDGGDSVSQRYKTRRVAPGARTDIENATRSRRDQMDDRTMVIGKGDALITPKQLGRLLGIVLGAADPYRFRSAASARAA